VTLTAKRATVKFCRALAAVDERREYLLSFTGSSGRRLSDDPLYRHWTAKAARLWHNLTAAQRAAVQRPEV